MTEIEKTEGEIKVLQAKLELLKEMEKHRSPAEEAFKEVYGYYPEVCERSVWVPFQKGYGEAQKAQKDYKVGEYQPTPQTPEQVDEGLRNAMKQAKEDGVFTINKVKFVTISRVIDPKTRIHYLDAVDENGYHWSAQQETGVEPWITYKAVWKKDPQQPWDL